jgi:SRSO17 transposase
VARALPGRHHDALNRLLRVMPWSSRALTGLLLAYAKRLGCPGYLALDDVIVEKAYAKRLRWAAWTSAFAKKRKVYGMHIVVVVWCSTDGRWRIPVGWRVWRPKRACSTPHYRTKLELAATLIDAVVMARLPVQYVVGDTHYTASWFTKRLARLGLMWQGTLDPKTHVVWRGVKQPVRALAAQLKLKWRAHLGVRATALHVYAPKYGHLQLVVVRNRHGNWEYLVTNALQADLTTLIERKRTRWPIETVFRDSKQFAHLEACQCWTDVAIVRHMSLVFLTFVVLQLLRQAVDEPVGSVKARWQLQVLQAGDTEPKPLRASPAHLRSTA